MQHQSTLPTTTETTDDVCPSCRGRGETPTGLYAGFSRVSMAWEVCRTCDGTGVHHECERCLDTGIDLEAPVNVAQPPACPCCHVGKAVA